MFKKRFLSFLCLFLISFPAYGVDNPDEILQNPQQEKRAEQIGAQLRCLVCQNESIEDSSADLAKDLRKIVRTHVQAGESDKQIMQWMVDRYGNFIRLSPPFTPDTALLWLTPFIAIFSGIIAAFLYWKKPRQSSAPPLSKNEEKRLTALLKDTE